MPPIPTFVPRNAGRYEYASFKVTQEAEINALLRANAGKIQREGVAFLDGRICILVDNRTPEEIERGILVESIQNFITQKQAQMLGADVDERYYRRQALKGAKNADNAIMEAANRMSDLRTQVSHARAILAEIHGGTWQGLQEDK